MKHTKVIAILLIALLLAGLLSACGRNQTPDISDGARTHIRVGTLRGPTGMGMAALMYWAEDGITKNDYSFALGGTPEEMTAGILSNSLDIAAVPTNVASALYNVTEGEVQVITICALGVFYILDTSGEIRSVEDLRGRTIHTAGQGATPEFALTYILRGNGMEPGVDVEIVFNTENAELASLMIAGEVEVALLPQPFATTVTNQDEGIAISLDLTKEWGAISPGSAMAASSIIVRTAFLEENQEAVLKFIEEFAQSVVFVNYNVDEAAELMERFDIVPAAVARRAIPMSNLVYISGREMIPLINGFLAVLYEANPQSVGGAMPDEAFFFLG